MVFMKLDGLYPYIHIFNSNTPPSTYHDSNLKEDGAEATSCIDKDTPEHIKKSLERDVVDMADCK